MATQKLINTKMWFLWMIIHTLYTNKVKCSQYHMISHMIRGVSHVIVHNYTNIHVQVQRSNKIMLSVTMRFSLCWKFIEIILRKTLCSCHVCHHLKISKKRVNLNEHMLLQENNLRLVLVQIQISISDTGAHFESSEQVLSSWQSWPIRRDYRS